MYAICYTNKCILYIPTFRCFYYIVLCRTMGFCSPLPPTWAQTIIFRAVPTFLCFPLTFLSRNRLLPVTSLHPYHDLFLKSCLADCLRSRYIQHRPASPDSRSSVPVFTRFLCQYVLPHEPVEILMLWETCRRSGTGGEPALWKWACLPCCWVKAKGRKTQAG